MLDDDRQRQAHQRAHIGSQGAIGTRHHDHIVFTGQTSHDLHHARVFGAGLLFQTLEQLHFGGAVQAANRVFTMVELAAGGDDAAGDLGAGVQTGSSDAAHRVGGIHERGHGDIVRIGKRGFLSANGPYTHTLINTERASFHNPLFQAPTLRAGVLKVQISIVHLVGADGRQGLGEVGFVQSVRGEQEALRQGQTFEGGFA